jgi:hypothetical protein
MERGGGQGFTFNGITRCDKGAYDLVGGEKLSDAERGELSQLCHQSLDAFRKMTILYWVVSRPEITLNRGAGPGGDTGAEEVLIFCPDSAFQLQG